MSKCLGGKEHGEVLTRDDDPGIYDETVLGDVPNGYQYGYCIDCKAPFRWVVGVGWEDWLIRGIENALEASS